jgi:phosphonate transport system substrate-binding protein
MLWIRRSLLAASLGIGLGTGLADVAAAEDWRKDFPVVSFSNISSENEADRLKRYAPVIEYLRAALGVEIQMHNATDYASSIEALRARQIQFSYMGPAATAKAYEVTGGKAEPLVASLNSDNSFGYHSVVVVRSDSPYQTLADLEGKNFAFADPNSASGFQFPSYYLRREGIDPRSYFARADFSGSHENSIIGLLNGTYDAAATWYTNEQRSNFARMVGKGMIPADAVRVIWKSPLIPNSPWVAHADLPVEMKAAIKAALMDMPVKGPEAWQALTDGQAGDGFKAVSIEDYRDAMAVVRENEETRRGS